MAAGDSIRKRAVGGGWVGGLGECDSTGIACVFAVRGLVSGGWPCTFAPGPRIQLAVKDR